MPDFGAIADAIAARYAPAALAAPAGALAIRSSSAQLPDQLGATPAVLVMPDAGTFVQGNGGRQGAADWFVRLYYDQVPGGSLERATAQLLDWLTVLADQHRTLSTLGGTVVVARTVGWRVGLLRYAGVDYAGLELRVHTVTAEAWTVTP